MRLFHLVCLTGATAALLAATPASARSYKPVRYGCPYITTRGCAQSNHFGDTVISGRIGLHRSDFGVMVPDSEGPNFIFSGRAQGTGSGANGAPGPN